MATIKDAIEKTLALRIKAVREVYGEQNVNCDLQELVCPPFSLWVSLRNTKFDITQEFTLDLKQSAHDEYYIMQTVHENFNKFENQLHNCI